MNIVITDNATEMVEQGKFIIEEKKNIYSPKMMKTLYSIIDEYMKESSRADKEKALYQSVYDYWTYGNSCDEEFYYDFRNKSHEEKQQYMTFRLREKYCNHLNCKDDADIFVNKYKTYIKYKKYFLRDCMKINGEEDYDHFVEYVKKHPSFVVKPLDMAFGVGVYLVKETDYSDYRTLFDSIIRSGEKNKQEVVWAKSSAIMLEEVILQDESVSAIHPWSVNGVRVTTVRKGDEVTIYHPWFKIGASHQFVTSAVFGTMDAGINADTGVVETDGYKENGEHHEYHPDTGIRILGFAIPHWDELKSMARELALSLDTINYVGWDFVLTPKGWCIMEGNYDGDFMWQLYYSRGMKAEFEKLIGWKYDKDFWWR